ncbi:hypothetical protein OESDEN_05366 [Oesophagostomum dentatum]|uniref:VWFA domain-containing protein n=1 Tax=Oesophagostomum dentatum TaxID=61180 RepID=A0A0B1TH41_OESDE|nr:hypothetical protein OESDEN_05366 [Oesophagostomum dentatum]
MCIECETNTAQRTVVVFDLLYNTEHVLRFVQRLLFCFAKTESNPLLIGYGGKAFTFERYLRHSEHPYEIWREARNYFLSHATDRREQHYGPLGAFEHLVKNDIFSDVPRHKRTLIFITSGKNLEESKEKEYIDKVSEFLWKPI